MRIFLPNSGHLGNIEGFLRAYDPADASSLTVAFHNRWVSVHPMVIAMVACQAATAHHSGIPVKVAVPEVRSMAYLQRMRLFEFLKVDSAMGFTEHESAGRFIPATQITNNKELGSFIADMVPLLHCSPAEADSIKYVISEMVRNVLEHANSPVGAFVAAQWFKRSNRLAVGIADSGRGVLDTMTMFHAPSSDREAIRLAMRPGVTGTTNRYGGTEYNAGAGLFFTKSIAAASRNFFVLQSGNTMFKLRRTPSGQDVMLNPDPREDRATWRENIPRWPGTAVGIDINVAEEASFAGLLSEIRGAYRLDVSSTKKAMFKKARFE